MAALAVQVLIIIVKHESVLAVSRNRIKGRALLRDKSEAYHLCSFFIEFCPNVKTSIERVFVFV